MDLKKEVICLAQDREETRLANHREVICLAHPHKEVICLAHHHKEVICLAHQWGETRVVQEMEETRADLEWEETCQLVEAQVQNQVQVL